MIDKHLTELAACSIWGTAAGIILYEAIIERVAVPRITRILLLVMSMVIGCILAVGFTQLLLE